ncbi:MAG TPA: ester cyclase [Rugosimonospora sp.]|nr:ester cyclase [Rugosimonospora sp.]
MYLETRARRVVSPADIVRTYFHRLLVQRDLSVCEELLADGYVDHDAPVGTPPGPESTRRYVAQLLFTYPDLWFGIRDIKAHGPAVALLAAWRGTHRESGVPMRQTGVVLVYVDDSGRLAERWSAYHWYAEKHG